MHNFLIEVAGLLFGFVLARWIGGRRATWLTTLFALFTGVSLAWCYIDRSVVWLIPTAIFLIVTFVLARRQKARSKADG